ncbi:hypothetical protein ACELLULO517_08135 [Acidisoma cellulosilytica]|uniref:Clp R domain-containing protein n=1 Tax=Acidisoma cellulosilyticum TaxID=2802395 RepID=A0A963Z1D0_9PROT|nr:hypothetical protein [Acidisoma cellulosilyticum]
MLSRELANTLRRSLGLAADRRHEYATLEHLLLGLAEDTDAATVLRACGVNLDKLRADLTEFLDKDLVGLATDRPGDPKPTAGFQRVVQRATIQVQSSGRDEVTGANALVALFSERESHAAYFLSVQQISRNDAVDVINRIYPDSTYRHASPPPPLPAQGIGPHVELNTNGVLSFPPIESIDTDGNFLPTLRSLHPDLREMSKDLSSLLRNGNVPHPTLSDRIEAYANLVDQELEQIDFRRLYAAGVRLFNCAKATQDAIARGDLPPLSAAEHEQLYSLLDLHGPFILATAAGSEAIVGEERYRRRPAEERQYRHDAAEIVTALRDRPDLVDPDVAAQMSEAVNEIDTGSHPERSTLLGRAVVRNVMIGVASGAIGGAALGFTGPLMLSTAGIVLAHVGGLALNETIKKTRWFQACIQSAASTVDELVDPSSIEEAKTFRSRLRKHGQFVMAHEVKLRRLAGSRAELEFVHRTLDWLGETRGTKTDLER